MDVFHHALETIKAACLGDGYLGTKIGDEILEDNAVAACKKGENIFDKVLFIGREFFPVFSVRAKINLLGRPFHLLVFLIGVPNIGIANGE